ncbi:hypothetical protein DOZ69_13970 [Pseudomonas fluorescens]|nr:hypothetical protein DOZ69_13970 [Pseudomonas fluorescens]
MTDTFDAINLKVVSLDRRSEGSPLQALPVFCTNQKIKSGQALMVIAVLFLLYLFLTFKKYPFLSVSVDRRSKSYTPKGEGPQSSHI